MLGTFLFQLVLGAVQVHGFTRPAMTPSEVIGEPHGTPFNDIDFATGKAGERIRLRKLYFSGCEGFVTAIHSGWQNDADYNSVATIFADHGTNKGARGEDDGLVMYRDEYINKLIIYTHKVNAGLFQRRTRISRVEMGTNKNQWTFCGALSDKAQKHELAPKDSALLYLSGSSGDALDALQAHWFKSSEY